MKNSLLLTVALIAFCTSESGYTKPISVEQFFKNDEFTEVRISPDGKYIATVARLNSTDQARNLIVMNLDTKEIGSLTAYKEQDIRWFEWASDDRLMFKLDRSYEDPTKLREYLGTYSIRRDGKKGRQLHEPFQNDARAMRGGVSTTGAGGQREDISVIDNLPNDHQHVLVSKTTQRFWFREPFLMDTRTGHLTKQAINQTNVTDWYADNDGVVRLGNDMGAEQGNMDYQLIYRKDAASPWKPILKFHNELIQVFGFNETNTKVWVAARTNRDRFALYLMDPETGDLGKVIYEDPEYDIFNSFSKNVHHLVQTNSGKAVFYQYMADKPVIVFLDQAWADRQASIDHAMPDTINQIVDWDDKEQKFVIFCWSDKVNGVYYLYDEAAGKLTYLISRSDWLDPSVMANMKPVSFDARDGKKIHGYLTMPPNHDDEPVPLIIHPHGGPYGIRDSWSFSRDVQFLASRGYAVLQVDYRGSGGYGLAFEVSAYQQWGLEMQDDLTDAVVWAANEGYADPNRVCIYGASYGGYAAVMGLVKEPDLFKCGIAYVAVTDLNKLLVDRNRTFNVSGQDWLINYFDETLGDRSKDSDRLNATSPINHVDRIRAPILVVHGVFDPVVDVEHSRKLLRELKRQKKPHEYLEKRYEGHGFFAERNNTELYTKIEEFLEHNL